MIERKETRILNENPRSVGLDIASNNPKPFVGTVKGKSFKAGRKVGEVKR